MSLLEQPAQTHKFTPSARSVTVDRAAVGGTTTVAPAAAGGTGTADSATRSQASPATTHSQASPATTRSQASPASTGSLLTGNNTEQFLRESLAAANAASSAIARARGPWTSPSAVALAEHVDSVDLDSPLQSTDAALQELAPLYLDDAVYFHHPRYAAHLNCPVAIPAVIAETLLAAVNSSMDTWDQSAGATLIERRLLRWTADRLGLGVEAAGVFTSGGTTSNLQALLTARNHAVAKVSGGGAGRLPALLEPLRIFASEDSHFSVRKSASLLGLGDDAVVTVRCDSNRRLVPAALREALEASRTRGEIPMAIVATAGTTDFGAIDPLPECADLAAEFGTWLHVDAAYGGGLITSLKHRSRLQGIERADSVTVDYHKTFFQPVSASAVLVRNAETLRHIRHHADYLNPQETAESGIPNQVDHSIQTTRRFDALKLWLTLRVTGADGIGSMLDSAVDLAADTGRLLAGAADFELAAPVQLSTAVFRYRPQGLEEGACDTMNRWIRTALADSGEAVVAGTTHAGRHYLKFTLLNPTATLEDTAHILGLIRTYGQAWLSQSSTQNTAGAAA